jgi:hypothetical protein
MHNIENHNNGQMAIAAALTEGFMSNQGHLRICRKSLSLHNVCKIPRTELVSAKSMTTIVKKGRQKRVVFLP